MANTAKGPKSEDINPASVRSRLDYRAAPVLRSEHNEGSITRLIEQQTAKVPSHVFLGLSLSAMFGALYFEIRNRQRPSRFLGMWVGPLLIMGVYNKLVKIAGPQ